MNTLDDWYPGDAVLIAGLEVLGMIAVLVAFTWATDRLLTRRRPALRSGLWLAALVGVFLSPALVLIGRQLPWRVGIMTPQSLTPSPSLRQLPNEHETKPGDIAESALVIEPMQPLAPASASPGSAPPPKNQAAAALAPMKTPPSGTAPSPTGPAAEKPTAATVEPLAPPIRLWRAFATLGLLIWGVGSIYLVARLVHGASCLRRFSNSLRPLDAERWCDELTATTRMLALRRLPEICVSPDVRSPFVAGLLRPRVVLPESLLDQSTPQQLREVLIHECAHVVRRDPLIHLLQRVATILLWIHPLVHVMNRRLDAAREEVCDNHVLAHSEAPDYAETLLTVAQICYPVAQMEGYLTMMPRRHNLERRVADLLEERRDTATRLPRLQRLFLLMSLVVMLVAVASVGLLGSAGAQDAKGKADASKQAAPAVGKPGEPAAFGKITGRVIHAADGQPVPGADVRLLKRGSYTEPLPTQRATANDQGEFTFDAVAPGQYRVWSFHGNLASRTRMYNGQAVAVESNGASKPLVLKLLPGVSVKVKVLAQTDGKPIVGARVRLIWTDTDRDHFTDAKGEVELLALTPETWHIEATAKGHAAETRIANLTNAQPAAIEMKLPPGGTVQGRAQGEDGRPLGGVGISVFRPNFEGGQLAYVETDAEGRYRLDHLPLGQNLQLMTRKLEYLAGTKEFRLDADKVRSANLDVVVKKRPHGGSVQGVVTDRKGKPIAGAEISNRGGSSDEVRRTKSDAQGKFLVDNVYSDSIGHLLVVKAKGFAPQRVEFKPGTAAQPATVAVQLEPGHRIQGRVVNEVGKPIAKADVYYADGHHVDGMDFGGSGQTDAQGRFQFDSLPADVPFYFRAAGYSEISEMKLALDGDDEVVVTMRSQGVIKGQVVDAATGKPIPRFIVRITFTPDPMPGDPISGGLTSDRVDPGEVVASPRGEFVLKDLMAGMPLQVTVLAEGYRRHVVRRMAAEAAAFAETQEFRLTPYDPAKLATVSGKLVNHRGESVRGAEVRLIAATERPAQRDAFPFNWQMIESGQIDQMANVLQVQRHTTAADGSFSFQNVPIDVELELVYWGKGIPDARLDNLNNLSKRDLAKLSLKAPAPARIVGTIDRKAYPEFSSIQLSGPDKFYRATVAADGKSFTIDDVPAGNYEVQVYGQNKRLEGRSGAFETSVLAQRAVVLEAGSVVNVPIGNAERAKQR